MNKRKIDKGKFNLSEIAGKNWWPPLVLLAVTLAAYGMMIFTTGLFGDDPGFLYTYYRFGAEGYKGYLGWQRPFASVIYQAVTTLFKLKIPLYQLTTILLRSLSAWLLFLNIRKALPGSRWPALWAAILSAVYPGFLQQPITLEYLLHFVALPAFLGSILLMQISLEEQNRIKQWITAILSLVMMGGMFSIEYFVGLELLRPLLVWIKLPNEGDTKKQLFATGKKWLPYFLVLIGYLYWHLFIFTSKKYQPTLLETMWTDPSGILQLLKRIGHDLWLAGVQVWGNLGKITVKGRLGIFSLACGIAVAVALFIFFRLQKQESGEKRSTPRSLWFIGFGILVMLAGGPPIWFADIPMTIDYPWDRTTLCLFIGACLTLAGILFLLPGNIRTGLLSILVGLSVTFHIQNNNSYLREWNQVRDIFWQLTWRAPDIQPHTMIMYDGLPTYYYPSNSYTPLLNWTYDPGAEGSERKYKTIEISQRLGNVLPSLEPDVTIAHGKFEGNTSRSIVIFKTSSGCLHVLRPVDRKYRDIAPTLNEAMALTDENLILPDPAQPAVPPAFMGPEPAHGWCYYLQKAELARQEEDWVVVAKIAAEVESQSLAPPVPFDWVVFVEGFARQGDWDNALSYLDRVVSEPPYYDTAVCTFLSRLAGEILGGEMLWSGEARTSCSL
ncbi:MAG TPA: hypothetical protein VMW28_08945 [Pelolinea sp.]|nr:hypothetical protein [Pelolinea sp.]